MAVKNTQEYSGASWTGLFSSAPVSADDAYVGTDGGQAITTNLDQNTVDLDSLTFMYPSRLRIGASGNPLIYEMSGPLRWNQRTGSLVFSVATSAAPQIISAGPNFSLVGGTSTLVESDEGGDLTVTDQHTLTAVDTYGGKVDVEYKSGDDYSADVYDGTLITRRNITTANVSGTLISEDGDATATTITVYPGGVTKWSGGTITNLYALTNGTFDALSSKKPFTITNLYVARRSDIRIPDWVTVSNTNYLGNATKF